MAMSNANAPIRSPQFKWRWQPLRPVSRALTFMARTFLTTAHASKTVEYGLSMMQRLEKARGCDLSSGAIPRELRWGDVSRSYCTSEARYDSLPASYMRRAPPWPTTTLFSAALQAGRSRSRISRSTVPKIKHAAKCQRGRKSSDEPQPVHPLAGARTALGRRDHTGLLCAD